MAGRQMDELEQLVREHLDSRGWDTLYRLDFQRRPDPHIIEAEVDNMTWNMSVTVDTEIEKKLEKIAKDAKLKVQDPVATAMRGVVDHERGHWKICPMDLHYTEEMLNAVSLGLQREGFSETEVKQHTPYVVNMIADAIINGTHVEDPAFIDGRTVVYTSRAFTSDTTKLDRKPNFIDYMGMWVDLQMKLLGTDDEARKIAEKYVDNYRDIKDTSRQLLSVLVGNDIAQRAFDNKLTQQDRDNIPFILEDRRKWAEKSEQFARIIAPYIKNNQQDMEQNIQLMPMLAGMAGGGQGQQKQSGSGGGSQQGEEDGENQAMGSMIDEGLDRLEEDAKAELGIGDDDDKDENSGNKKKGKKGGVGDEDEQDEAVSQQMGQKVASNSNRMGGGIGREIGYAPQLDVFDALYRRKAGQIVLNFQTTEGDAPSTPLFYMAKRKIEENESLDSTVAWERTMFVHGEPWIYKKEVPFEINLEGPSTKGSYEDIMFMIDVSGSMDWNNVPLDGGKYDMALRTVYAVIKYLEKSGKAPFMNFGLMQFSGRTTWSGWQSYGTLKTLRNQLFTGFEGGGTVLSTEKVLAAEKSSSKHYLTIMVSDGGLANTDDAFQACRTVVQKENDFVLFQIQDRSSFGQSMASLNVPVIQVDDPKDIIGISLDIVRSKYAPWAVPKHEEEDKKHSDLMVLRRPEGLQIPARKLHT